MIPNGEIVITNPSSNASRLGIFVFSQISSLTYLRLTIICTNGYLAGLRMDLAKNKNPPASRRMDLLCGERGIRTLGTVTSTTVFETVPFDHSGTSPEELRRYIFLMSFEKLPDHFTSVHIPGCLAYNPFTQIWIASRPGMTPSFDCIK